MVDVRRLRVLWRSPATGSFSAAAASLGYTQPAVSRQVALLEAELGTMLVRRLPQGVGAAPTPAACWSRGARPSWPSSTTSRTSSVRSPASRADGCASPPSPRPARRSCPLAIARFRERYPAVELTVTMARPDRFAAVACAAVSSTSCSPTSPSGPRACEVSHGHHAAPPARRAAVELVTCSTIRCTWPCRARSPAGRGAGCRCGLRRRALAAGTARVVPGCAAAAAGVPGGRVRAAYRLPERRLLGPARASWPPGSGSRSSPTWPRAPCATTSSCARSTPAPPARSILAAFPPAIARLRPRHARRCCGEVERGVAGRTARFRGRGCSRVVIGHAWSRTTPERSRPARSSPAHERALAATRPEAVRAQQRGVPAGATRATLEERDVRGPARPEARTASANGLRSDVRRDRPRRPPTRSSARPTPPLRRCAGPSGGRGRAAAARRTSRSAARPCAR